MLSRNNGKSTWAYEMHYAQSFLQYPDWVEGSHSDDLFSVFGEGHYREIRETLGDYNTADHETKDYVMSYLTNFAWTGLVKFFDINFRKAPFYKCEKIEAFYLPLLSYTCILRSNSYQ